MDTAIAAFFINSKKTYLKLLSSFAEEYCEVEVMKVTEAVRDRDWSGMFRATASLRGSSGYVGAGQIYYACCYVLHASEDNDFTRMKGYHPLLIEAYVSF